MRTFSKISTFFSKNRHDSIAIFFLLCIILIFLAPSFIQKDVTGDFITQEVPWYHYTFLNLKNGILPFWSPYAFSGLPYLFKPELAFFHPFTLITLLLDLLINSSKTIGMTGQLMELMSMVGFCVGGVGIYILARRIVGISSIAAIFAATAYTLNPFVLFEMHSTTVLQGVALLPWLIFFVCRFIFKPTFFSFLLLTLSHYLLFLGYSYHYIYFIVMEFALVLFLRVRRFPSILLSLIVALLLSSFFLFSYFDIYANSPRNTGNHDVAFHSFASLTPFKIIEFVIPVTYSTNIIQTNVSPIFNGPTLTFGTFAFVFLLFGIFSLKKNPINFWLIAVFLIGLFYSFGGNLQSHAFFGELIPPILKFRFHARAFLCIIFAGSLLIGLGVQAIIEQKRVKYVELILWSVLLLLFVGLVLGELFFLPRINLNSELFKGITISLLFLFSALLISALAFKYKKNSLLVVGLIIMVLEYNLFFQNFQDFFTKNITYNQFYNINSLIPEMPAKQNLFRMYFEDNQFAYNTSVLNIYNTNGYENSPSPAWGERYGRYGQVRFYQLSNVKYVVTTTENWQKDNPDVLKIKTVNPITLPKETYFHSPEKNHYIYEIKNYLPRFYVPDSVQPCDNKECLTKENPPKLIVAKGLSTTINNPTKGTQIIVSEYETNMIKLKVTAVDKVFIASSETWDRGWKITINGKPSTIYNTSNGTRGFIVPKGTSQVEMSYFPPLFLPGVLVSCIGIIFLFIIRRYTIIEI